MTLTLKNIYFLILKRVFSLIFEREYIKYLKYLLSYFEKIWQRCCSWKFQSDLISCSSVPYVAQSFCEIWREKTDERREFSPAMGTCYPCSSKVGPFQTSENQRVVIWGLKWDQDSLFREEICKRQKISLYQPLAIFILHKGENSNRCWRTTNPRVYWATARAAWKVSTETTENGLFQLNKLGFDDGFMSKTGNEILSKL